MRQHLSRMMGVLHLGLGLFYLQWRLTRGVSPTLLGVAFLAAELFVFLATFAFTVSCWRDPASSVSVTGSLESLSKAFAELPYVDVLVIRRWDSVEVTRQTALAALRLNYPWHRFFVYVVDLEADPTMGEVAQAIPCEYVSCSSPTVDPLRFVLDEISTFGEFCLVLEAGQFPDPDLLLKTLPYFFDQATTAPIANTTGFVQVQLRALGHHIPDHPLQQRLAVGQDGGGVAPYLGTGALFRRKALQSLTNLDSRHPVALGCQLHLQGWKSYLCSTTEVTGALLPLRNRRIALLALLRALQMNPFGSGQLDGWQRLHYLWLGLWSSSGLAQFIYLMVPIIFLCLGIPAVLTFDQSFLWHFLPYILMGRLSWLLLFRPCEYGSAWWSERQTGSQFFQSMQAWVQSWRQDIPYREQPSQLSLGPQGLLIVLTLSAIAVGVIRQARGWDVDGYAFGFAILWASYNLLLLSIKPPGFDFLWFRAETEAKEQFPVT
ncbi:MAG: cellulose synthase [Cyanobacteriota bacterium]|nr:cellulose synthase [Cyanobacteriota bacterium]